MVDLKALGKLVLELIAKSGYKSIGEFCRANDFPESTILRIARGTNMNLLTLDRIATALDTTSWQMLRKVTKQK